MARKKAKEKKGPSTAEIKKLWKLRPPQEWLGLLQEIAPQQEWEMKGLTQITAKCPYHPDNTPSFMLSFEKGMGKCFGGSCGKYVTDIISLVAKLRNSNYMEALLFVYNRFGIQTATGDVKQTELNKYNKVQECKKAAAVAMQTILTKAWFENPPHLDYCRPAAEYLVSVRQIPPDSFQFLPMGIFAKPIHMKEYIDEAWHGEYDDYFAKYNKDIYYGNLCFYYNDSPGSISVFKFRQKNYNMMQSLQSYDDYAKLPFRKKSDLFSKSNTQYLDDPFASLEGVYGLFTYQHLVASQDTNAYLTEGEFDVLSVMAHQFLTGRIDFMIFGTGGKGATDVHFLKEFGIKTVWLVPDHPSKEGDGWARTVLGTRNNFNTSAGQTPLQFKVFQWPVGLTGFDLDEAVKSQGFEIMARYLATDRNSNFVNAMAWLEAGVVTELDEIKVRFQQKRNEISDDKTEEEKKTALLNIREEEKTTKYNAVLAGYRYVCDPTMQAAYTNRFASEFSVDISQNDAVNNTGFDLGTVDGVADKIKAALAEYMSFGYYLERSGGICVYGWSKSGQNAIEIQTKESEMFKNLSIQLGQETLDWLDTLLQANVVYNEDVAGDGSLSDARIKRRNAKDLLNKAFERSLAGLRNFNQLRSVTQGVHYINLPRSSRLKNEMYMVNGNNIFKGTFQDTQQIDWQKLETTVDGTILFETLSSANQWSSITDISDLYDANKVKVPAVFKQVRKALDGWVFKYHDTTAEFLAAQILAVPIMAAVGNVNIVFMTGEKESGKTSLVEGLLGGGSAYGSEDQGFSILEPSKVAGDTTNAAIYQAMDGSSRMLVFDEAESKDGNQKTNREKNMEDFIRTIYGMPQGTVPVNRGGKDKEGMKEYRLKFPLWFAAIATPPDIVFLSRCIMVKTVKQANNFKPIQMYMDENFSPDDLRELRKQITVGLLPHIPEIVVRIKTLRSELQGLPASEVDVSNRFMESLLTPLVVYEMAGGDPKKLFKDIVRKNKTQLQNIHSLETQSELVDACLFNRNIKITTADNMSDFTSARQMIVSADFVALNNTECGVYVMESRNWMVFVWRQAKYTVLKGTKYYNYSESSLKDLAHKSKFTVEKVDARTHAQIVAELNLPDVKSPGDYTVVLGTYLSSSGTLGTLSARPSDAENYPESGDCADKDSYVDACPDTYAESEVQQPEPPTKKKGRRSRKIETPDHFKDFAF